MTPAEADQRIMLSRQTLSKYVQMMLAGESPALSSLQLFAEEISILQAIADEHQGKAMKIERIADGWTDLMASVRRKLN